MKHEKNYQYDICILTLVCASNEQSQQHGGETRYTRDSAVLQRGIMCHCQILNCTGCNEDVRQDTFLIGSDSVQQMSLKDIKLTGEQFRYLQEALIDAYNKSSLAQMVRIRLERNLESIADGNNLSDTVFELIRWAERTGHVRKLIREAYFDNSGNEKLKQVARVHGLLEDKSRTRIKLLIDFDIDNFTDDDRRTL